MPRTMMDRATFLFLMAFGMTAWFVVGQVAGHGHPGGEVLGFAGAIWCAWQNETGKVRRRRRIARRRQARLRGLERIGDAPQRDTSHDDANDDIDDEDGDA